jgi:hypothetical protein
MATDPRTVPPEELERRRSAMRGALDALRETVMEIGRAVEEKKGERCPYRTAKDECTYRGGCVNRIRPAGGDALCGGDHMLKREPGP